MKQLLLDQRRKLAIGLLLFGGFLVLFFGYRSFRSFQELQYIREQGLDQGTADVNAIRPWMSIRFIATAYAVPEDILYEQLRIPPERRNPRESLFDLNNQLELGPSPNGEYPAVIDIIQPIILAYQENPTATGLDEVRGWMNIKYISVSTGVPAERIVEVLGFPADVNQYQPLEQLNEKFNYPGGPRAMDEAIENLIREYQTP